MTRPKIVLVTGSGRSGTSSVAGTLQRLGLHVPQPEVPADERNPRGYYEPAWVTQFHKELLEPIPVRTIDTRPDAADIALAVANEPEVADQLRSWIAEQLDQAPLVIKDPRAMWILPLWQRLAGDLDVELSVLTMLRHPAEVVRSRDSAYLSDREESFRRRRETANVAAWINAAHITERFTRGLQRAFVRYDDLTQEWRPAMARAGAQLGLSFNADLSGDAPHEVDTFIDARLNTSRGSWDNIAVSGELRALAEATWEAMSSLVEHPADGNVIGELEGLHRQYAELYDISQAIAMDATTAQVRAGKAEVRRRKNGEIAALTQQLSELQRENAALQTSLTNRLARKAREARSRLGR